MEKISDRELQDHLEFYTHTDGLAVNIIKELVSTRMELARYQGAMGYITGLGPDVLVDVEDPFKMAVEISSYVKKELAELRVDARVSQGSGYVKALDDVMAKLSIWESPYVDHEKITPREMIDQLKSDYLKEVESGNK
jgi:hypothetical protein